MKIIDFYKKRYVFFAISAAIIIIGIIMTFINGMNLDIQFKGGSILKYTYTGNVNSDTASDIAEDIVKRAVSAQITTDLASGEKRLVINIAGKEGLDAKNQSELDDKLKEAFPDSGLKLSESQMVEPFFGKKFLLNSITAILLASVFVVLYVWIRFRRIGGLSAGVMALVALLHDLIIVLVACVLFRIPIGETFVAVALSIIGYSINDTIVIYDRIRENAKLYPREPIETVTNLSITQSMTRSINTNLAVVICIGLIAILASLNGIDSIRSFAIPMALGSISGCYSTICIAGPLWVMWKKRNRA